MYVCMYVRTYVGMYGWMHVCMYVCMCIYIYIYIYICMCVYIYIYIYIYILCITSYNLNGNSYFPISSPYFQQASLRPSHPHAAAPSRMNALHQAVAIHAQGLIPVATRLPGLLADLAAGWEGFNTFKRVFSWGSMDFDGISQNFCWD